MGDRVAMMVCPLRAVAAFTVSVCVAAFAPFAVNTPVPVTVTTGDPATVSLKKKVALFDPPGMVRFEPVTTVVHVLSM
jgi:signal recognition particle receptor subunit beta